MRPKGLTLVEVLVVLAVLGLLLTMGIPSLAGARQAARQTSCAAQLHQVGTAMANYSAESHNRLPPFLFSDFSGNLPLSGHYGGLSGAESFLDRPGDRNVNLLALCHQVGMPTALLVCPGASQAVLARQASYFSQTTCFSTYCTRMPYTSDLWPGGTPPHGQLDALHAYRQFAGGQRWTMNRQVTVVPQVRNDRQYRLTLGGRYDPGQDAVVSDAFWDREFRQELAEGALLERSWCHQNSFNVMHGEGSVRRMKDDGTIFANSNAPTLPLQADSQYNARYSEAVWRYFDAGR